MKANIFATNIFFSILLTIASNGLFAAEEWLSADQVRELLVGNTEKGYTDGVPYTEYVSPDGRIKGKWKDDPYEGSYEILADGCLSIDYDDGNDYDGCYYFEEYKSGKYRIVYPSGKKEKIKVLESNSDNL